MDPRNDLLNQLTVKLIDRSGGDRLSSRLCEAYREVAGAQGAAITLRYETADRVTLCTTNEVAHRLEDLQDLLGEGPGHTAVASGQVEVCGVPTGGSSRWSMFVEAAQDLVHDAVIYAVPMRPNRNVLGVITLYQSRQSQRPLALSREHLQFLANVVGTALLGDADAAKLDATGPWASRARIHQATGMVVAQLRISADDALAVLRAHAYGQQTTLWDIASAVVERRITFSNP